MREDVGLKALQTQEVSLVGQRNINGIITESHTHISVLHHNFVIFAAQLLMC